MAPLSSPPESEIAAASNSNNNGNRNNTSNSSNNNSTTSNSNSISNYSSNYSYDELQYAVNSYYAIVQPVLLTMVLSAAAVVFIATPESTEQTTQALENTYNVVHDKDDDSNAQQLGNSLINGIVIVSVICAATFLIVLLYKYRCMSCLIGYMILSSTLLLGFLAAQLFLVAIQRYQINLDKLSFYFISFNFCVVGVTAIFGGPFIVPSYVNQAYLILTSVIVAWQLAHLQPFLAWVLLVLLALYDLMAVLTPCGPLKALVNLMSSEDAPNMPGLLYEASLPTTATTSTNVFATSANANSNATNTTGVVIAATTTNIATTRQRQRQRQRQQLEQPSTTINSNNDQNNTQSISRTAALEERHLSTVPSRLPVADGTSAAQDAVEVAPLLVAPLPVPDVAHAPANVRDGTDADTYIRDRRRTASLPFVLAKQYKLQFLRDPQPPWMVPSDDHTPDNHDDTPAASTENEYTAEQLRAIVEVVFSRNGGYIVPTISLDTRTADFYRATADADDSVRYTIVNSQGEHKRVVFVNRDGRIFEDLREENAAEERKERSSIRLGLGDFIFYSVLVSKAAQYSYTTFAVCTLAILSGLGLTLLLLAVYGAALPALPISIALGVAFYLITRFVMEPWVHAIFTERVYA